MQQENIMKSIVLLSLVALVSSANVKRQILLTQPILPMQPINIPIPTIQTPMLPLNQMPIMTQQGSSFLEQQRENLVIEAPETVKNENLPITQQNLNPSLNLQTLTNEQLRMLMLNPNFNLAQFGGLNNLRANLPIMLPLPPNIQLQNPGLQQILPNLFNPAIMNPINNLQPHSFSSFLLPNNQFASQILPMSQFSAPLIQGQQQFSAPFLLPKPAQRLFNILPTTLAPEFSLNGNLLPQKNLLSSGIKGRIINTLPNNSNKNLFTPKDAPIMQESM